MDPLSSNKGFWVDVLGVGDFYYELAIQIVNICIALRKKNGGFLEEAECLALLKQLRAGAASKNSEEVTMKDLRKAVDSIHKLGSDFRIIHTGSKRVICSVALELNADHMAVLKHAEEHKGTFTYSSLTRALPQYSDRDRFGRAIHTLIQDGLCWEDEQNGAETAYWFPSLMQAASGAAMDSDLRLISD